MRWLLGGFLLSLGWILFVLAAGSPHDFAAGECSLCHEMGADGQPISTDMGTATCYRCHPSVAQNAYMHPVNIRPRTIHVPFDFPLSREGLLTCSTCHNVHAQAVTPFGSKTYFLRRLTRGKPFCDSCHEQDGVLAQGHEGALGMAHLETDAKAFARSAAFMGIDPLSKQCLSCHDGSFGSAVTLNTGQWQHRSSLINHDSGSHPIGIDYEAARLARGARNDLRPIDEVDRRITFYNGRVGCGSCHNPYSRIEKKLVMSNRRSALCFACHAYDGTKGR